MNIKRKIFFNKMLPAIILFGLFFYIVGRALKASYYLHTKYRYTIGITKSTYYTGHLIKIVVYSYYVNGAKYEGNDSYRDSKVPGGKYFVKFSVRNPSISEILQDKPIPDSITKAPSEGWYKIPNR